MIDYKSLIASKINCPLPQADLVNLITETADDSFGDYSFPCFRLAKEMKHGSILINLSGRGDKDMDYILEKYGIR